MALWRAVLSVLFPFAVGFYFSYLFRTINAVTAAALGADLRLGAAELGALTSAYFLTFAAAQLPVGVALDRFGPRRVQLVLLPVAAAGSALFASAENFELLLLGRALIGLGVAAALMAGLKALVLWFPKERLASANGCYMMVGALGAMTATLPAETLLGQLGWRGLFSLLAIGAAGAAVLLLAAPRDPPVGCAAGGAARLARLRDVYLDGRFWRVAPLSGCCIGTAFALQGLWAGPWLADVAMLDRAGVARGLFAMALGLGTGAVSFGVAADRLRRRGVRPADLLAGVAAASLLAQAALVLRLPVPPEVLWALIGATSGATVLSYAELAACFPKELVGRANGALNLLHIGGAFLIQSGIGLALERWPADAAGRYPAVAYAEAFGFNMVPQALALAWFLVCLMAREQGQAADEQAVRARLAGSDDVHPGLVGPDHEVGVAV
jgi:MFS family permease